MHKAGSAMSFTQPNLFYSHLCWQTHSKLNWQKIQQCNILGHQHNKYELAEYSSRPVKSSLFLLQLNHLSCILQYRVYVQILHLWALFAVLGNAADKYLFRHAF